MPRGRDRLLKRRRPIQTAGQLRPSRAAASAPAGAFPPGVPAGPLPPPASGREGHGGILHLPLLPRPDLLLIQRAKRSRGPDAGRGQREQRRAGCALPVTFLLGWEGKQSWEDAVCASPEAAVGGMVIPRHNRAARPRETSTLWPLSLIQPLLQLNHGDLDIVGRAGS